MADTRCQAAEAPPFARHQQRANFRLPATVDSKAGDLIDQLGILIPTWIAADCDRCPPIHPSNMNIVPVAGRKFNSRSRTLVPFRPNWCLRQFVVRQRM